MKPCDAIADTMAAYRDLYNLLEGEFDGCELSHIGRGSNEEADTLANIGSTHSPIPPGVFLEQIDHRSTKAPHSGAAPIVDSAAPAAADLMINPDEAAAAHKSSEVLLVEPAWTSPYLAYILH
jgi:hypothetical protein